MIKKIVIGGTIAVLAVYLGFVLVGQVLPYVNWMLHSGQDVRLSFASADELLASNEVTEAAKRMVRLPETVPDGAAIVAAEYRDDGFTSPQIVLRYERNGSPVMDYRIGGNAELTGYEKLKSVALGETKGELFVGRDNTVVVKWRDVDGPPFRYVTYYDPALTEDEMVRIAASVPAVSESSP